MPHQRAHTQGVLAGLEPVDAFDAVDIDDDSRAEDAKVHHRHEALAARQHPRVLAGVAQKANRFVDITRGVIVEPGRFHVRLDLASL